jgi:hypothetical protein
MAKILLGIAPNGFTFELSRGINVEADFNTMKKEMISNGVEVEEVTNGIKVSGENVSVAYIVFANCK